MKYTETKTIICYDQPTEFKVEFSLDDDCHNGVCDFSITGYARTVPNERGEYIELFGGCCHEEIAMYFPELVKFIPLHLSNEFGQPMQHIQNFSYYIGQRKSADELCEMFRVTKRQLGVMCSAVCDQDFLKYQLFTSGIIDKWRRDAEEAIAWLEEKTGETFTHTCHPRFSLIEGEWMEGVEKRMKSGEFTSEAVRIKKEREEQEWREKKIREINEEYERNIQFENRKRELALWCVQNVPTRNYSFWAYNGVGYEKNPKYELALNYYSFKDLMTKEEYQSFMTLDIPEDLIVTLKNKES